MYSRFISIQNYKSFFLFGPRGVGKSAWVSQAFPKAIYIDLLRAKTFNELLTNPSKLEDMIPLRHKNWVVIDEVQKIPSLLDEVHYLIEKRKLAFVLTGSSARKLKRSGVNLLAGRALTKKMFPLTVRELGEDFNLKKSLRWGHLPMAYTENDSESYLHSYLTTYLKEEILLEGLTRNIEAFSRFLEAASFSQAQYLNISQVAADCHVERKSVTQYFSILEDLLLGYRLPIFTKRAKRELTKHPKFYFFDCGVYQTLRPRGPLDSPEEIDGPALETLVLQNLMAENEYHSWRYDFFCWSVSKGPDVDFVMYGPLGLIAFEIKRSDRIREGDLEGLIEFKKNYPIAKTFFIYGGTEQKIISDVQIIPVSKFLTKIETLLHSN